VHPDRVKRFQFFYRHEAGQLSRNGANENGLGLVGMWVFMDQDCLEPKEGETFMPSLLLRRKFTRRQTLRLASGISN